MAPDVLTVSGKSLGLDSKCIAFYIDNNAAKCGLIKADSKVRILAILSRIFWEIVAYRNFAPWLERVDSDMDSSDLPTRLVELTYRITPDLDFHSVQILLDIVKRAFRDNRWGFMNPTDLIRRYF